MLEENSTQISSEELVVKSGGVYTIVVHTNLLDTYKVCMSRSPPMTVLLHDYKCIILLVHYVHQIDMLKYLGFTKI